MIEQIMIHRSDGSMETKTVNVIDQIDSYVPTTEDRLAALESAMLSMMGVSTDV